MRSVAQHLGLCLAAVGPLPPLAVSLSDAVGCVLAQDVQCDRDFPPTDQAALDGYALDAASAGVGVRINVMGDVASGDVAPLTLVPGTCARVVSGAPLPRGANAVIPMESTDMGEAQVELHATVQPGDFVRTRGCDAQTGEVVLRSGLRLSGRQIALLAGIGWGRVRVHPRPRVVIVSIGSELVEPGSIAQSGQVFDANGHALMTAARDAGGDTYRVSAVPDERSALRNTLEDQLVRADVIITTGGLSYGQSDTVKEVLGPLGTVRFDNVAIAPGRQLGVGEIGDGVPIFCLPGNPVAAQVAFESFVRPALRKMGGWQNLYRPSLPAKMLSGWNSPAGRREFVPVIVKGSPEKGYQAEVCDTEGTLTGMSMANGFAVVPEEQTQVNLGDTLHCMVVD